MNEELIKRYIYLENNKELILAMCIDYGIDKPRIEKKIKEFKKNYKDLEKYSDGTELDKLLQIQIKKTIKKLYDELKKPQLYLMKNVDNEIVECYQEFLFTDKQIEETDLYKHVEAIKNNENYLSGIKYMISSIVERRSKCKYLTNMSAFTVWKILSYVRRANLENKDILKALDKYYDIARYVITGINWQSGYILEEDIVYDKECELYPNAMINYGTEDSMIFSFYDGNSFEEEDDYIAYSDESTEPLNDKVQKYESQFIKELNEQPYLDIEEKMKISNKQFKHKELAR